MAMSSKPSLFRDLFWRRLSRNRMAVAGGAIVLGMFALALLAPLVARDPGDIDIARRLQSPTWAFPLGTDDLGRDVLARIFYGARISLLVGFVAVGISTLIGIVLGALAGWRDRKRDSLAHRGRRPSWPTPIVAWPAWRDAPGCDRSDFDRVRGSGQRTYTHDSSWPMPGGGAPLLYHPRNPPKPVQHQHVTGLLYA